MLVDLVVGARPNFVKAAAILEAAKKFPELTFKLVHTGQHAALSDIYWRDLDLPLYHSLAFSGWYPDTITRQARYFEFLKSVFQADKPDLVMVVGDTDSTLAGALVAAKMGISVAHVEAGLRCGDMKMQEEINRILVDSIAAKHYTTTEGALENLHFEGHKLGPKLVGNVMVDTLYRFLPEARNRYKREGPYAVLTLHRAENVDDSEKLSRILDIVDEVGIELPVIWPVHPRVDAFQFARLEIDSTTPMGYLQFIALLDGAKFVMTDSGGVQEETTALGIPCMTLRSNTERPETCHLGTNKIVGNDRNVILETAKRYMETSRAPVGGLIPLWDGCAAERILKDLCQTL